MHEAGNNNGKRRNTILGLKESIPERLVREIKRFYLQKPELGCATLANVHSFSL
jgi:hypothetical protein